MNLIVQIQSLAASFLYGIVFSFSFNIMYAFLFSKYRLLNVFTNICFSLLIFGVYYIILYLINGGIIHIYFLILLFASFYLYNKAFVKLRVKCKNKWLN